MKQLNVNKTSLYSVVKHARFTQLNSDILTNLQNPTDHSLLLVIGPSGVGKTTYERYLHEMLKDRKKLGIDDNFGPPIYIEVPVRKKNEFPWRSFLEELLIELGDDGFDRKVDFDQAIESLKTGGKPSSRARLTLGQLERLVIRRIGMLRPIAILMDECQGFCSDLSESVAKNNLETLKSWTNKMDTRLILFGTHESSPLLNLNEQLSRRVKLIYFRRYKNSKSDLVEFMRVFKTFTQDLGLKIDGDLGSQVAFIYNHSLGCVGLLFDWLARCCSRLAGQRLNYLTKDILILEKSDRFFLEKAETEIKLFEQYMLASAEDFDPNLIQPDFFTDDNSKQMSRSSNRNIKPGLRKSNRDLVRT